MAATAALINKKLEKGEPRTFDTLTPEEEYAFATLQYKLISAPVLPLPRCKGHLTLDTDACDK